MTHIPDSLRRVVYKRAGGRCEYCLLHERYNAKRHEVDHIRAEKHGGKTVASNLALSCYHCNRFKGNDLTSVDPETDRIETLFDPRHDRWEDHFALEGAIIKPLTAKGRATVYLLRLNEVNRVALRKRLIALSLYP